jgi:hypothetical protein
MTDYGKHPILLSYEHQLGLTQPNNLDMIVLGDHDVPDVTPASTSSSYYKFMNLYMMFIVKSFYSPSTSEVVTIKFGFTCVHSGGSPTDYVNQSYCALEIKYTSKTSYSARTKSYYHGTLYDTSVWNTFSYETPYIAHFEMHSYGDASPRWYAVGARIYDSPNKVNTYCPSSSTLPGGITQPSAGVYHKWFLKLHTGSLVATKDRFAFVLSPVMSEIAEGTGTDVPYTVPIIPGTAQQDIPLDDYEYESSDGKILQYQFTLDDLVYNPVSRLLTLDEYTEKSDEVQTTIADLLVSTQDTDDLNNDYTTNDPYVPSDEDRFQTRLSTAIDDWIASITSFISTDDYDCNLTGLLAPARTPINIFVNSILRGVKDLGQLVNDGLGALIGPFGGFIDNIVAQVSPVLVEAMIDILNFVKNEMDFIPFAPEIAIMFINILGGSSVSVEFAAMIAAIGHEVIDNALGIIDTIVHVLDYLVAVIFDVGGVEVTWYDLSPVWNRFVGLIAEDQDDYASIGLYATRIGIQTVEPDTLKLPSEVTFNQFGETIDFLDAVLTAYCAYKLPLIHPLSIPVPIGLVFYLIKDITVPLSDYLSVVQTDVTRFGGLNEGFTFKDVIFDIFVLDMAIKFVRILGPHAMSALMMAFNGITSRLKPNVKDIIHRISPDGESFKYNPAETSIWDVNQTLLTASTTLNEAIETIQVQNSYIQEFQVYLYEYSLWLHNPRSTSRPIPPTPPA